MSLSYKAKVQLWGSDKMRFTLFHPDGSSLHSWCHGRGAMRESWTSHPPPVRDESSSTFTEMMAAVVTLFGGAVYLSSCLQISRTVCFLDPFSSKSPEHVTSMVQRVTCQPNRVPQSLTVPFCSHLVWQSESSKRHTHLWDHGTHRLSLAWPPTFA